MACVLNSKIYHKVGGSRSNDKTKTGHIYVHYLNRLIDVRNYMPQWQYPIYKRVLFLSVIRILKKAYSMPIDEIFSFIKKINNDSKIMDGVSKDYFLQTVKSELKT